MTTEDKLLDIHRSQLIWSGYINSWVSTYLKPYIEVAIFTFAGGKPRIGVNLYKKYGRVPDYVLCDVLSFESISSVFSRQKRRYKCAFDPKS